VYGQKFVPETSGIRKRNADLSSRVLEGTGRYLGIRNGRRSALCGWARPAVNLVWRMRRYMSRRPHCLTQLPNSIHKTCWCFATEPYRRLSLHQALKPCQKHATARKIKLYNCGISHVPMNRIGSTLAEYLIDEFKLHYPKWGRNQAYIGIILVVSAYVYLRANTYIIK
jgi:hypothetical protein